MDIVEQLRGYSTGEGHGAWIVRAMTEAANEIERLREALAPFAALAEIFDVRRGTTPTEGEIYQWCIGGKEYSLTVEHLREARRALAPSEDRT